MEEKKENLIIDEAQSEELEFSNALALAQELLNDPSKKRINMSFTDLEENDEVDDEVIEKTDDGKIFSDKMLLRLKMALDRVKKYYSDLRNYLTRYPSLILHTNKSGDVYLQKNKVILRVTVFSRALKVYLGLNPKHVDAKYHTQNMSDKKKYGDIPVMIRVSSDRSYKYLIELVETLAKKYKLKDMEKQTEIDYVPDLMSSSQEILSLLGYSDLIQTKTNIMASDALPNTVAKNCQVLVTNPVKVSGEKIIHEITVGELSSAFGSRYEIDLNLLKEIGIASEDANYLKVTAKGVCRNSLKICANDYDLQALKMIIITGGNVVKYVN